MIQGLKQLAFFGVLVVYFGLLVAKAHVPFVAAPDDSVDHIAVAQCDDKSALIQLETSASSLTYTHLPSAPEKNAIKAWYVDRLESVEIRSEAREELFAKNTRYFTINYPKSDIASIFSAFT